MYQYDSSYAVEVQRAHPDRFALVTPVDPADPAVADVIAEWKRIPSTVAVRLRLPKGMARAPDDPGVDRIVRAAVRHDFPINVLMWGNLEVGTAVIDRHPSARFIIDHLGIMQPLAPPAPPQPWVDQPYPFADIWDPLARVFDAWGFDRCLWGTDWTRAFAVVNFGQAVKPFLETGHLSHTERAMLMGGACAKAYGWSPRKKT
jgi:predicted TIM-barrel fold metal-dependent hydrolase